MISYAPQTVEENLANINALKEDFWWHINIIRSKYDEIRYWYESNKYYNSPEIEIEYKRQMQNIAYTVNGFTIDVYERISYAADCWMRLNDRRIRNNRASSKNFDQAMQLLAKRGKIRGSVKEIMLQFRPKRNYGIHFGRTVFIDYVFSNSKTIYDTIEMLSNILSGYIHDEAVYEQFVQRQCQFIDEMNEIFFISEMYGDRIA